MWEKILFGAPQAPPIMLVDSSTGLGQIFVQTAINAHNAAIKRGDITGQEKDFSNWRDREEIWMQLRDDNEFNILYVGLVLKYEADKLGISIDSASSSEIERILTRYNGAAAYGKEVKQYHDLFVQYNSQK